MATKNPKFKKDRSDVARLMDFLELEVRRAELHDDARAMAAARSGLILVLSDVSGVPTDTIINTLGE